MLVAFAAVMPRTEDTRPRCSSKRRASSLARVDRSSPFRRAIHTHSGFKTTPGRKETHAARPDPRHQTPLPAPALQTSSASGTARPMRPPDPAVLGASHRTKAPRPCRKLVRSWAELNRAARPAAELRVPPWMACRLRPQERPLRPASSDAVNCSRCRASSPAKVPARRTAAGRFSAPALRISHCLKTSAT